MSYFVTIPMNEKDFGTSDIDTEDGRRLRRLIAEAIHRSPLSRKIIAESLTDKLGIRVTERMLNDYTAFNKRMVRFPLLFSAALCEILNDDSIGLFGVRPRIRRLVEFAERELAGHRDQRERESLREELLKGVEK